MDYRDERELLAKIGEVAMAGGAIIKSAHAGREDVSAKAGHANFVTVYDEKVQAVVMAALKEIVPEAHFVGEEDGKEVYTEEDRHGLTFVVDPIDGTSNFMKGLETSVCSIGLLKDGKPWLGAICNPFRDALFTAAAGHGAWKNGKRITSSKEPLSESLVMFGTAPYYSELRDMSFDLARRYLDHCIDVRRFGAAAWDFCLLAEGKLGMFFEMRLGLWDYCAGALIAKEAGCRVTDLLGRELAFDGPSSVAAASAGTAEKPYLPEDLFGIRPVV